MTSHLSVLQKAKRADVRSDPYPYIVVENALPAEICEDLVGSYPSLGAMGIDATPNNLRWDYSAFQSVPDSRIPKLWRDFIAYHVSAEFFREILDLFAEDICRLFPARFLRPETLRRMRVGVRKQDRFRSADILMEAQISGNTPVETASSVRTTHVDSRKELFGGLFYLRRDGDDSVGGDLTISRFKPQFADYAAKQSRFEDSYVDDADTEIVETVKYRKNTLVLFVNSIDSLHGVTVRQPTKHSRIFVNLVGEVEEPLFEIPKDIARREAASNAGPAVGFASGIRRLFGGKTG
jgi:hypothetical protein